MSFYKESVFFDVINHGKFFFPAWKHYGNPNADVRCDRCYKSGLRCSVGYQDKDLCLDCTEIVCDKNVSLLPKGPLNPHPQPIMDPFSYPGPLNPHRQPPLPDPFLPQRPYPYVTRMAQDIFKPDLTLMGQDMYRQGRGQYMTNMEQNFFKK